MTGEKNMTEIIFVSEKYGRQHYELDDAMAKIVWHCMHAFCEPETIDPGNVRVGEQ